jgi:ABC-2 type transport system ATP-binding protein
MAMTTTSAATSATAPRLQVSGLYFAWPKRLMFDDWSCSLGPGITWLRGENGAGKTTLLKLLGGALDAKRGQIRLNGMDIREQPLAYREHSFWCSSESPDFSWLSVQEFLDLHLSLYPQTQSETVHAELEAFHMLPMLNHSINTLSLGQHKKLHLCLALALPVHLLLIDEPFNALDVDAIAHLRQRLSEPKRVQRQCIVMTSHVAPDVPLAQELNLELF